MLNIWTDTVEIKEYNLTTSGKLDFNKIINRISKDYPNSKYIYSSFTMRLVCYRIIAIYKIKATAKGFGKFYVLERFDGAIFIIDLKLLHEILNRKKDYYIINLIDEYDKENVELSKSLSNVMDDVKILNDYGKQLKYYRPNFVSIIQIMVNNKMDEVTHNSPREVLYLEDRETLENTLYNSWKSKLKDVTVKNCLTAEQLQNTFSKLQMMGLKCSVVDIHTILSYDENNDKSTIYTMQVGVDQQPKSKG